MGVNDTDIWGVAKNEEKECFYCGEAYTPANSTAPEDFKSTYCSAECYEKDHLAMQLASEAEARFDANSSGHFNKPPILDKQDREDFKMKVPKGWDKV